MNEQLEFLDPESEEAVLRRKHARERKRVTTIEGPPFISDADFLARIGIDAASVPKAKLAQRCSGSRNETISGLRKLAQVIAAHSKRPYRTPKSGAYLVDADWSNGITRIFLNVSIDITRTPHVGDVILLSYLADIETPGRRDRRCQFVVVKAISSVSIRVQPGRKTRALPFLLTLDGLLGSTEYDWCIEGVVTNPDVIAWPE